MLLGVCLVLLLWLVWFVLVWLVVVVFIVLVGGVGFGGFCVLLRCLVGGFAADLFSGIVIVVGYF